MADDLAELVEALTRLAPEDATDQIALRSASAYAANRFVAQKAVLREEFERVQAPSPAARRTHLAKYCVQWLRCERTVRLRELGAYARG